MKKSSIFEMLDFCLKLSYFWRDLNDKTYDTELVFIKLSEKYTVSVIGILKIPRTSLENEIPHPH